MDAVETTTDPTTTSADKQNEHQNAINDAVWTDEEDRTDAATPIEATDPAENLDTVSSVSERNSEHGINAGTVNKGICINFLSFKAPISDNRNDIVEELEPRTSTKTKNNNGNPTKVENF